MTSFHLFKPEFIFGKWIPIQPIHRNGHINHLPQSLHMFHHPVIVQRLMVITRFVIIQEVLKIQNESVVEFFQYYIAFTILILDKFLEIAFCGIVILHGTWSKLAYRHLRMIVNKFYKGHLFFDIFTEIHRFDSFTRNWLALLYQLMV